MTKKNWSIFKYAVPILAVVIILIQFAIVKTTNLTKWKAGGFGMYTEVHCYYNEVYIKDLKHSLDSLRTMDHLLDKAIKEAKCLPNDHNLKEVASSVSTYMTQTTITVQVWKPSIESNSASYSRELINELKWTKP